MHRPWSSDRLPAERPAAAAAAPTLRTQPQQPGRPSSAGARWTGVYGRPSSVPARRYSLTLSGCLWTPCCRSVLLHAWFSAIWRPGFSFQARTPSVSYSLRMSSGTGCRTEAALASHEQPCLLLQCSDATARNDCPVTTCNRLAPCTQSHVACRTPQMWSSSLKTRFSGC